MRYGSFLAPLTIFFISVSVVGAANDGDLKAFPPAQAGYERYVIRLPAKRNEHDFRIELLLGKEIESDCNAASFIGTIAEETIDGWGYSYVKLTDVAGPASTLMACPPEEVKENRFVSVQNPNALRRYNSKLPVVIYLPQGFEARYRIWNVEDTISRATKE